MYEVTRSNRSKIMIILSFTKKDEYVAKKWLDLITVGYHFVHNYMLSSKSNVTRNS